MAIDARALAQDFRNAAGSAGLRIATAVIEHELQPAGSRLPRFPAGKCAVYIFSLSAAYGARSTAGQHRVLKVGRVGPNSGPRFTYQHYSPQSARSNLANSLVVCRVVWPYLGIESLVSDAAGDWIRQNTDRDHFFVGSEFADELQYLEAYLRARLGPVFEG